MYYVVTTNSHKYFIAEMIRLTEGVYQIIEVVATDEPALFWPEGDTLNVEDSYMSDEPGVIKKIFSTPGFGR